MASPEDEKIYVLTMRILGRFLTLMETLMIRKATDAEYPFAQSREPEEEKLDGRFTEVHPLLVSETDTRPDRRTGMKKGSNRIQQLLARLLPVSSKRI